MKFIVIQGKIKFRRIIYECWFPGFLIKCAPGFLFVGLKKFVPGFFGTKSVFWYKIRRDSGWLRVARGGSGDKGPPLAARPNVSRPKEPQRRYKSELRPTKHESPLLHYWGAAHAKVPVVRTSSQDFAESNAWSGDFLEDTSIHRISVFCFFRFQSIWAGFTCDNPNFRIYKRKKTHALLRPRCGF